MVDEAKNADQTKAAESKEDSSTLEADVAAKLAEMRDKVGEDDAIPTDVTDDAAKVEPESKEVEPKPEEVGDTDDDKDKESDLPMLPVGHRRAAINKGYTTEEIDYWLKTDPDKAIARCEELFEEIRIEGSIWSDRGRALRAAEQKALEAGVNTKVASKVASETLSHFDEEKLIDAHPESEALIKDLITPLNAQIDRMNATTEELSHSKAFLQNTEKVALLNAIQEFLSQKDMKPFNEHYGTVVEDLTSEQKTNRMKLYEQADILAAGAMDHGKDITVTAALEHAHILLSQGTRDEFIRSKIRDGLKKRTKSLPSSHQQTSTSDKGRVFSAEEFERRTAANMAKLRAKT